MVRVPAYVIKEPDAYPSSQEQMTVQKAAEILKLTPPIEVDDFAGFEDGGTVKGTIHDAQSKYMAFRRSPWATPPMKFYLTIYEGHGLEEMKRLEFKNEEYEVSKNDLRLKAFSVLCLDWVDRTFSKGDQWRIRSGFPPKKEQDTAYILNLFRQNRRLATRKHHHEIIP